MKKEKNKQSKKIIQNLPLEEAVAKIIELSSLKKRRFIESLDLAVNLGIDPKQSDQTVKGVSLPPNGLGKEVRIAVFTSNEEQKKIALDNGALLSGTDEILTRVEEGFIDFDYCIATPESMTKISKIARKLGPRGLMPSPKNGTVTSDIKKAILEAKKGKVEFKNDKGGTIHCSSGKINFELNHLIENIKHIIKSIKESKPESSKGKFIKSIYLNSSMGKSVLVDPESI